MFDGFTVVLNDRHNMFHNLVYYVSILHHQCILSACCVTLLLTAPGLIFGQQSSCGGDSLDSWLGVWEAICCTFTLL